MVQQLGLLASTAGGPSSIPGQETKIPKATQPGKKKNKTTPNQPTNQKVILEIILKWCINSVFDLLFFLMYCFVFIDLKYT